MGKIGLIALDLDGTLLDPAGRIRPDSKQAIAQAKEAGVEVLLATGRAAPEAAWFAQEAGCGILAAALGGRGNVRRPDRGTPAPVGFSPGGGAEGPIPVPEPGD